VVSKKRRRARKSAKSKPQTKQNQNYWFAKFKSALNRGDEARAELALQRSGLESKGELLQWLLCYWPQRALQELKDLELYRAQTAFSASVLFWDSEFLRKLGELPQFPKLWLEEAKALLEASALMAESKSTEALRTLRSVKPGSIFSEAHRFLRGLLRFYQGKDPQPLLNPLLSSPSYGAVSAAILSSSGHQLPLSAQAQSCVHYLKEHQSPLAILNPLREAIQQKKRNRVLVEFSRLLPNVEDGLALLLRKEIPSILYNLGMNYNHLMSKVIPLGRSLKEKFELRFSIVSCGDKDFSPEDQFLDWAQVAKDFKQTIFDDSEFDNLNFAAILHHSAVFRRSYIKEIHSKVQLSWLFRGKNSGIDEDQEGLILQLEEVVRLDPKQISYWEDLIQAHQNTSNKARTARTIERFVRQFPESPKALIAASQAAGMRGAWDKGLRYASKATELEPLNRRLADLQAEMLRGKALKKFFTERTDLSRNLLAQARKIPNLTPNTTLAVAAESSFLEQILGSKQAEILKRTALLRDPRPWAFSLYERIFSAKIIKKNEEISLPCTWIPEEEPSIEDLMMIISEIESLKDGMVEFATTSLLLKCASKTCRKLETEEEFRKIISVSSNENLLFEVAQVALEKFPLKIAFFGLYYDTAISLDKPKSCFDNFESGFQALIESLLEGEHPHVLIPMERLENLRERILDYLRNF